MFSLFVGVNTILRVYEICLGKYNVCSKVKNVLHFVRNLYVFYSRNKIKLNSKKKKKKKNASRGKTVMYTHIHAHTQTHTLEPPLAFPTPLVQSATYMHVSTPQRQWTVGVAYWLISTSPHFPLLPPTPAILQPSLHPPSIPPLLC